MIDSGPAAYATIARLRDGGFDEARIVSARVDGRNYYRVRLGHVPDVDPEPEVGTPVELFANIELPQDAERAKEVGADGIADHLVQTPTIRMLDAFLSGLHRRQNRRDRACQQEVA